MVKNPALVYGVFDPEISRSRKQAISAHCTALNLPVPNFDNPDFIQAAAEACEKSRAGYTVIVVGFLQDLYVPTSTNTPNDHGGIIEQDWRYAWLEYLASNLIQWNPLDGHDTATQAEAVTRRSVIRSYQRSYQMLIKKIAQAKTQRSMSMRVQDKGYSYGRPPYGYKVVDKEMRPDPAAIPKIRMVFACVRQKKSYSKTADILEKQCKTLEGEWWDAVKVRRIIQHARMYCLGEYSKPGGDMTLLPHLVILPKEWSGTKSFRHFQCPRKKVK
jgi:hypothetical protein